MKTTKLIDSTLDWAVAKCEGVTLTHGLTDDERYSTDWAQGGPIIEREKLNIEPISNINGDQWVSDGVWYGPTPLIAAMRCYVASKLGDKVEIPEELK